jgi:hypothetical protein
MSDYPQVLPAETPEQSGPGPAKEGIVIDQEGNPVGGTQGPQGFRVQVHTVRGGFLGPVLLVAIPLLLTVGLVIFAIAAAALVVFWVLRLAFFGGPGGRRPRKA